MTTPMRVLPWCVNVAIFIDLLPTSYSLPVAQAFSLCGACILPALLHCLSVRPKYTFTIATRDGGVTACRRCASGNREWSDAVGARAVAVPPGQFSHPSLQPALPTSRQSSTLDCTGDGKRHIVRRRAVAHKCLAPAAVWVFGNQQTRVN